MRDPRIVRRFTLVPSVPPNLDDEVLTIVSAVEVEVPFEGISTTET